MEDRPAAGGVSVTVVGEPLRKDFFLEVYLFVRHPEAFAVKELARITTDPQVMGGKPCIRGLRITVGTIVGLVAAGHTKEEILGLYPYLEEGDIAEALSYAAWRAEEIEVPLGQG
jgi:uncharacterized protein (DUF433 family)